MTTDEPLGLRDRKRLQTRGRIEDAAIFLVLRDGLEATTVDAISERADLSPRTFFNYFDTKDAAILGVPIDDPAVEPVVEPGGEFVPTVVALILETMGATQERRASLHQDRVELIRRHPEVLGGQMARLTARAERLTAAIADLMRSAPEFARDKDRAVRAEVVLALCSGATRAAMREWVEQGSTTPIDTIAERATALITQTVRKLA
ncbi:MAG: hypothetical protein JWO46_3229 [Nocardioidaceae bacterium]|nr:hypothetical protein [Nocardioidaceae bacterium]